MAVELIGRAVNCVPTRSLPFQSGRGVSCRLGEFERAAESCRSALRFGQIIPRRFATWGRHCEGLGRPDEAVEPLAPRPSNFAPTSRWRTTTWASCSATSGNRARRSTIFAGRPSSNPPSPLRGRTSAKCS